MSGWPVVLAAPPDCGAIADGASRCYGSLPAAGIAVAAAVAAAVVVGHAVLAALLPSALTMVAPPEGGLAGQGTDTTADGPEWPPPGPVGPKPALGQPGADEWRYERYRQKCYQQGRPPDSVLPYDQWRQSH